MAEKMVCSECGREPFPAELYQILDNGNPACPECFQKESEKDD